MTRGGAGAAWPQIRKGLIAHTKLMLSSFDTPNFRAMLAALENGEEVALEGGLLGLVLGTIGPGAARPFNNRNDPENRRRFVLTGDDWLIETESLEPDRPR
jgi:hypothetical protein